MCMRPKLLGLMMLAAGVAFLISSAICSVWLLLIFGILCVCGGVLFLRR